MKNLRLWTLAAVAACGAILSAPAASKAVISTAGTVFVDLDADHASAGTASWFNAGTIGDFVEVGNPVLVSREGARAVNFNYSGPLDSYQSQLSAPAGLTGLNPTRTIEAWVWNPGIPDEETIVSWGHRGGPDGSNMAFNYGTNGLYGAVGHWGCCAGPDIGWNNAGGAPTAGQWHHLAYTFDGAVTRVYADGVLANSETSVALYGNLNTHPLPKIALTQQYNSDGLTDFTGGLRGTMAIGKLRIHDGVLSDADIANNYNEERPRFPLPAPPVPEPLHDYPAHRYSFNDGTADDSIGTRNGVAVNGALIDGGKVTMNGAGQYIDLLGNDIAALAGINGAVTLEAWGTYDPGTGVWSRIADLGDTNAGTTFGRNYILASPRGAGDTVRGVISDADPGFNHENIAAAAGVHTGLPVHTVFVFDDANNSMQVYVNGVSVAAADMDISLATVSPALGYLGRSLYNDPYLLGMIDEFRIYNYALSANEVLGNYEFGPDELNVVPEPSSILLAVIGLGALAFGLRRRT